MEKAIAELKAKGKAAKAAARKLAYLSTELKNRALANIADSLITQKEKILAANKIDLKEAKAAGMAEAMLDRLLLNASRLEGIARDVMTVAALPDPVGEVFDMRTLPNGLLLGRKRVPLGVIGAIYESRPNVTIDISVLCLKSGNAVILRGMPEGCVQFIDNTDRKLIKQMLKMNDVIDLLIPRGGAALIKFVRENAAMPVVGAGASVCHTYVDQTADMAKAVAIAFNAKVQRPSVCNALDTLLVHADIAPRYLPQVAAEWAKAGVEMHCDKRALAILKKHRNLKLVPAVAGDWGKEFLALVAAVKVVDSLDEALKHIARYGTGADEAIITEDYSSAMRFLNEVDTACIYVNASTRFTDGGQFGLGAEVGISTQKMHARGPVGLKELTTYKWIIFGNGQVRP
jgi:glutamate-5-semialdehyde dehydrogenase